ncbi:MAG: glycosyltransferase family 1 protein [Planctomycetaceae bacterium]|nr:glycosyltransferase family 1 protein [Planctomycetaceae bacterium]
MRRRLALISEHASPLGALGGVDSGGQNVYVAQVARHLALMGHHVDVFTRRDDPELPSIVRPADGLRVIHVDAGPPRFLPKEELLPWMDEFSDFMLRFIKSEGSYDLIHSNFFMSGLVGCRLKAVFGTPLAVTFHALGRVRLMHQRETDRFPAARLAIEAQVMRDADAIIAECPQDQADQCHLYGAAPRKIHLVPCGFDRDELGPVDRFDARRQLGLDPWARWLVHVGRMVPRKGVDTVIEAIARLQQRHGIVARLLIVGGESDEPDPLRTPEIGRLIETARRAGVAGRVIFTGRRQRGVLRYYYSAADVFLTTPWYEPFGITPVEAMACGTPVIGSQVGGLQYTVVHGRTGFLVPPKDPNAVARRLATLYRHPRLLRRMGRAGLARVNRLFTWQRVARQLATVFESVLAEQRVAPGVSVVGEPVNRP